jgi:carboxymethylenebutenolidase
VTELVPIPSPGVPLTWGEVGDPLIVVLHDWYGRLPWLEPFAEALSRQRFRVVVPDLYNGVATTDEATAGELLGQLDVGAALAEIDDAIAEGRDQGSERIGVVGFSMGGWLALLHAQGGESDAVVAYYASLGPKNHGVIPAPVLLHFAEFDDWDEGEDPEAFVSRLRDHGTPVTEHTYLATQHSFANANIRSKVNPQSAALAFARTVSFFERHLVD